MIPFIERKKKKLKEDLEDWKGDYDVKLGRVETSGDGYESLEIEKSG